MQTIYLAGGCFWGLEAFIKGLPGIIDTEVGYANGNAENPSYEDVCHKELGFVETVRVIFDENIISVDMIIEAYLSVIDPTSLNKQGGDAGLQYRTGIYFTDAKIEQIVKAMLIKESKKYSKPIVTEVTPLNNYYPAEEYHQDYLDKNPKGYCHIHPKAASNFLNSKK